MPREKSQSPSDDGSRSPSVRRRVIKACQRCRLKKCKCDGATPCLRCKSDDAICAYGKHKKSEKLIFRKGYVQMLERQHAQLIAGLQELYRRTQTGESWTLPHLEPINHRQPLTHEILESLGVLRADDWEDGETLDGLVGMNFEELQAHGGGGMTYDAASLADASAFSQPSTAHRETFPNSEIMAKRRTKQQISLMGQTLDMPPALTSTSSSLGCGGGATFSYDFDPNAITPGPYAQDLRLQIPLGLYTDGIQPKLENPYLTDGDDGMADDPGLPFSDIGYPTTMYDQPIDQGLSLLA